MPSAASDTTADTNRMKLFGAEIQRLIRGEDLSRTESYDLFRQVLEDAQTDLQQGAFLAALSAKGETASEIAGAWQAIDELDTERAHVDSSLPLFENSGTGMDRLKTFNVSTAAAVVAASRGVAMARHGARALTSNAGTVDLAEAVGVDVECAVSVVGTSIEETGLGLFNGMSSRVHPKALGRILSQIRFGSTLNIAASLANPAQPTLAVRGVWSKDMLPLAARVMRDIGYERGMVVHGVDDDSGMGMDELSPCGPTYVCSFDRSGIEESVIQPQHAGLEPRSFEEVASLGSLQAEAERFVGVLSPDDANGWEGCRDFTCLNAAAIFVVSGTASTLREGRSLAHDAILSGDAYETLERWVETQQQGNGGGLERLRQLKARICSA